MIRVLLLYGGRSSEHEISCLSARSVLEVIDRDRYEVLPVGITREGRWTLTDGTVSTAPGARLPEVADAGSTVALVGTRRGPLAVELDDEGARVALLGQVDVAFPVLHGPGGEDGTVQGMFETLGLPYVGADVTASSIGIDKAAMKASFAARGLPQMPYRTVHRRRFAAAPEDVCEELATELLLPVFTKPARQGSSIGIRKVSDADALHAALEEAFAYDEVAVIEQGAEQAREIELGVLGNDDLEVSRPGEIVPSHDFYDFEAKYLDDSQLLIPAALDDDTVARAQRLARASYRAIGCRGLARVDLFLLPSGELVVNEINTIPGFTPQSMFPRLFAAEGMDYPDLVDRLLSLAMQPRG